MYPFRKEAVERLSDGELVRLLLAGNHDAMAVIFDRYYRLVMSVALRIIHDVGEAEDVVQTVFTDFYQRADLFDETKGNLKGWLLQYTYGRSFNQKRKLKNHSLSTDRLSLKKWMLNSARITPSASRTWTDTMRRDSSSRFSRN